LQQFLTGVKGHYDIPKKCKKILQCVVVTIENGSAIAGEKIKLFDNDFRIITTAWVEK
ncbi:MAG: metallophosphoesterase, partial [Epsilonproteobacteria bacterium]|nr:metallophosphoesterase [Campylobacterota bacterium]